MTTAIKRALYTARATADFGRDGTVRTDDGEIELALAKPPGMGGTAEGTGTNPEQLFAMGYAACFHGALLYHAKERGVEAAGSSVTAEVHIGTVAGGGLGLAVDLTVDLPGVDADLADALVELGHAACPYSRATRDNIVVTVRRTP